METMKAEQGVGLSANQVGLPVRMMVISWQGNELCLVNPVVKGFGKTKTQQEGCLSFPDIFVDVKRASKCRVQAWDLFGDDIDEEVSGDLARIVQHEMDHLDGVLFIDRLSEFQLKTSPLKHHLAAMEHAWNAYGQHRGFPADAFNEILKEYCGVSPEVEDAQTAHTG